MNTEIDASVDGDGFCGVVYSIFLSWRICYSPVSPWAYMEPLPPLPGKGLASVTKRGRSQNDKGKPYGPLRPAWQPAWAYMGPLPPLLGKGLASVTKRRRSQNGKKKKKKKRKKSEREGRKKEEEKEKEKEDVEKDDEEEKEEDGYAISKTSPRAPSPQE